MLALCAILAALKLSGWDLPWSVVFLPLMIRLVFSFGLRKKK